MPPDASLNRRRAQTRTTSQRRGDETRALLLDCARKIGGRKPYPRIVVQDITEAAKTSRATFYLYFENKDDIYLELARQTCDALYSAAGDSWTAESPAEAIREATAGYAELFVGNADVLRVLYIVAPTDVRFRELLQTVRSRFYARIERNIVRGMEIGVFRRVDAFVVSRALGGMVESYFSGSLSWEGPPSIEPTVEILSDLWYHAIRAPAGAADAPT